MVRVDSDDYAQRNFLFLTKLYLDMNKDLIIEGNCLDALTKLPDSSVDLVGSGRNSHGCAEVRKSSSF